MTEYFEPARASRTLAKIIGVKRNDFVTESGTVATGALTYHAFTVTEGYPNMAFTLGVYHRAGDEVRVESHGIFFHDLKKPKWKTEPSGYEYITFTHAGEAYNLRGRGLYEMYTAMLDSTLQNALEFEPSTFAPVDKGEPIIDRVGVTDVVEMVRRARDERGDQKMH